jgi:hypothetical protein
VVGICKVFQAYTSKTNPRLITRSIGVQKALLPSDWTRLTHTTWCFLISLELVISKLRANIGVNAFPFLLIGHASTDCRGVLHQLLAGQWTSRSLVLVDGCLYVYRDEQEPATGTGLSRSHRHRDEQELATGTGMTRSQLQVQR